MLKTRPLNRAATAAPRGPESSLLERLRNRKQYMSNPPGQFKLMRHFVFVVLASALLAMCNVFILEALFEGYNDDPSAIEAPDLVGRMMVYGYGALSIVISICIVYCLFVLLSHRLGGPVHRIGDALLLMADGDLSVTVKLRKGDFLQDLANNLNITARVWRRSVNDIERSLNTIRNKGVDGEIARELDAVEKVLKQYRTSSDADTGPLGRPS